MSSTTVLGKRSHQPDDETRSIQQHPPCPPTPELTPNPKRARTTETALDGTSNKENIPPVNFELNPRSLRRTTTELNLTPSPERMTPRRHASTSNLINTTPSTAFSGLSLATPPPTPPNTLQPIHARARALLRSKSDDTTREVTGRAPERAAIQHFIDCFLNDTSMACGATSLYMSGSPGTGKTALARSMLGKLSGSAVTVIYINCMEAAHENILWDQLAKGLSGSNQTSVSRNKKAKGLDLVRQILSGMKNKCIIVLDEIDRFAASSTTLTSLLSLPSSHASVLRLIGIANTHTLTSTFTLPSFSDQEHVQTLHFRAYTGAGLLAIVKSRLVSLYTPNITTASDPSKLLSSAALNLLCKKIATQTGDVRLLLEVLCGAIERAVEDANKKSSSDPMNAPLPSVTPSHVLAALKANSSADDTQKPSAVQSNSAVVTNIRNLGFQAQVVFLLVLVATKRADAQLPLSSNTSMPSIKRSSSTTLVSTITGLDVMQLHTFYVAALSRSNADMFTPVSNSEFVDIIGLLEGVGLLQLSSLSLPTLGSPSKKGRKGLGRSTSMGALASRQETVMLADGVRSDEALRGLSILGDTDGEYDDVRIEEIKSIWRQETTRFEKELKTKHRPVISKGVDAFEQASED